jgi:hypothetical protein
MMNTGIAFYDIVRAVRGGNYARAIKSFMALAISGALMRMLTQGTPGPDDDDETWTQWMFAAVMDGTAGQIPVIGGEIMDAINGVHFGEDYTIATDSFWKLYKGAQKIAEGRGEDGTGGKLMRNGMSKEEYGALTMAQGFAMLTGTPWNQARRLYTSRNAEGVADMLLANIGNRRAAERIQKAARERASGW